MDFIRTYNNRNCGKKAADKLVDLLPLLPSDKLSSIVGHLIGDGNLSKDPYVGDFRFYGSKEKLKFIKEEVLEVFNILPKSFYSRKGGFVLKYNNCVISRILYLVGTPRGNKVTKCFEVPLWIRLGAPKIKKAFLVAICDDELSSPRIDKRGNIEPLRLKFNKTERLINSGILFLEQIRSLFIEFGITCSSIKLNNAKYINCKNQTNRSLYFNISSKLENFIQFRDKIGFHAETIKLNRLRAILKSRIKTFKNRI